MQKFSLVSAMIGALVFGSANAADITIYYSPSCPHCHHARDFISDTLIYEYPELKVTEVNVTVDANREVFRKVIKKCEYKSGGVPVMVIGDKCFQGYADFMQDDMRRAIEVDMSDSARAVAAENKAALATDADAFRTSHADRKSAISEYDGADAQKKNDGPSLGWLYGLLGLLVVGLGFVLVRGRKKK